MSEKRKLIISGREVGAVSVLPEDSPVRLGRTRIIVAPGTAPKPVKRRESAAKTGFFRKKSPAAKKDLLFSRPCDIIVRS